MRKVVSRENLKRALNRILRYVKMKVVDSNEAQTIASRDLFQSLGINTSVILDVGANVGQFAKKMSAAIPEAEIYSFEPNPVLHSIFEENLRTESNVFLQKVGVGAKAGILTLSVDERNSLVSSFHHDHGLESIECEVLSVDEFVAARGLARIGLLKVDVEGFELEVIKGCAQCFKDGLIDAVILEATFTPATIKSADALSLIAELKRHGFSPDGFYDLDYAHITGRGRFKLGNLLFVRN